MQQVCVLLQHKAQQPGSITTLHPQQLSDTLAMLLAQSNAAMLWDPVTQWRATFLGEQSAAQRK